MSSQMYNDMDREVRPRVTKLHRFIQDDGGIFYNFMGYTVGPFDSIQEREEHIKHYYQEIYNGSRTCSM